MASVEPEPEVYRRRKSYRVDLNDKQRIIGGIGRRRSTANGPCSINDRILQYGKSTENGTAIGKPIELNNNETVNIPRRRISTTTSPDIGKILSPQCNEKTVNLTYCDKTVSLQSNEKTLSSQNNENAVNLECNEKFVNSQINEKIVNSQINEQDENLEYNDNSITPQVNEKNFSASNIQKAVNLECNEKNVSLQDNEKNLSLQSIEENIDFKCHEKTIGPQTNEKTVNLQSNEKTASLQGNEKSFCAQVNEKTVNSQNNEKIINPQNKNAFQTPQIDTLKEENSRGASLSDARKVDVDISCHQSKISDRLNSPILTRRFPVDNSETVKNQTKEANPILNKRRSDSIVNTPQVSKSPDRLVSTVAKPGLPFYSTLNGGHTENHSISLKMAADTVIKMNKEEKLANAKKNNKNISPPLSINSARNKFLELEKHSTHLTDHQAVVKKSKAFKQKNSFDSSSSSVDYGNNKDKSAAENLDETTAQEPNIKTRSSNLIKRDENANSLQSHTDSEKCTIKDKSHLIEYQLLNNDPAIINNISNIEGELGNSSIIQIDGCSPDLTNHAIKSDRPLTNESDTMLTEDFEMDSSEVDVKSASTINRNSESPSDNTFDNNNKLSAEESEQLKNKNQMRKTENCDKNSEMLDKADSTNNSALTDCENNFTKNKLDDGEPKCPAEEVQVNITDRQNPKSDIIYAVCDNAESNDTVEIKNCSSTWTPSDSDTSSNLDISELSSPSLYEDKEPNKKRKLVKRRSRSAEQEYTQKSNQLPETRDNDALECNNSSDECNKSVHIGSPFFDNSINVTDYSSIDASNTSEIKTSLYSEKELSIVQSSIVPKSNENLFTKDLNLCDNSEAATTHEISKSIKSSSMTAISNRLPQSLHSFSTSDMGGLESENQANNEIGKLENYKGFKQAGPLGSFTSISKVSTLKLQSFKTKTPMFSPPLRRRSNSSSENHGFAELAEGQHNIIQTSPFSIEKRKDNKKCPENDKPNENSLSKSISLPRNFSSPAKPRTPSEEEDSARTAEVLDNLPSSPFALIARFSKDVEKMQVKSVGPKNENYTDRENVSDNTLFNPYREPELLNKAKDSVKSDTTNYTQIQDEPKNNNSNPKVKTRPTLNMSSINRISVDENNTNTELLLFKDGSSVRRRPSYLHANDENYSSENISENQVSENIVDDIEDKKKPADVIPIEEHDSDSDDIERDFRKNIENPTRTRPNFGPPGLPNIPEEHINNRPWVKKPIVSGVFPEDTISEESSEDNGECVLDKVDKAKSNHDDSLNTQKHLSLEDLTNSDCIKLDGDGTKSLTSLPTIEEKKKHSDIRTPKIMIGSLSDPLLSNNLEKSPSCSSLNPQCTMSLGRSEEIVSQVSQVTEKTKKTPKVEMRMYVLKNLLETEQSYVQNLSTMITKFSEPLKRPENSNIIEPNVVDEIFYQIPEILEHHEIFLKQLTDRANVWDDQQIVGDLFINSFTKTFLMDAYSNFINNFIQAKAAIRQAVNSRPQFARYLEQCTREHREKLTLSDLLITPVQRIPRYKLLLLDMLKYTPEDHPDYENIHLAIEEIEALADRMNKGEMDADQAERDIDRLREIEVTIEGIQDLVTSSRRFIRQDLVAEKEGAQTKKDRCLFLFSDLLVCTTVRRKNNALRRGSLGLFTGQTAADMNRYKFLWKIHLDDVDISKATNPQAVITNSEIEKLEEDLQRLKTILTSIEALSVPHHNVEGSLRELTNDVRQQIQEKQWTAMQSQAPYKSRIDLQALTEDGMKEYTFIFLSTECKSSWSSYFEETKQKLVYSTDSFPPEFQYPVPITKTRSGMQFTCASPSQTMANYSDIMSPQQFVNGEVWVCNSDGYVGQVCLISMVPEAQSKASLSVCSVRILCLAAVPGGRLLNKQGNLNNHNKVANVMEYNPKKIKSRNRPLKKSLPSESDDDESHNNAANIMAFDSSDDEDIESPYIGSSSFDGRMSPDGSSLGTVESQEGDHDSSDGYNNSSDEEDSTRKDLRRDYDNLSNDINEQTTMWLGTEDGNIYVYNASDVITQRKSKMKLQHGAPVTAILYFESRVFVALGSGELCIYTREQNANVWQISKPEKIQVSITGSPISCITAVAGRIWCGCQNTIVLVNAATLETETTFTVSPDHNKLVHKIVSSGLGVWVSMQNSATVRLYHATTYENVAEIDVTPAVNKMLAGADAIIRQHKSACLRVTSMLICKDLLWIGTSAGVILTNPLPSITASTSVLRNGLNPTGSPYGHTGHVRFLTLVEVAKSQFKTVESNKDNSRTSPWLGGNHSRRESTKSMRHDNDANGTLTLVLSGGDGYEDFRFSQQSETVGRDDSTNHLLIWRV